ncbi:hypothetical protein LWI28_019968 [Acer negundo]|uniref:Uncharacterized protein n=1 Tax=Acer negundo TaxID=4023 RepID=A0AAD5P7J1_ACENE|nr:hypothetical protein LWI28_019968 [Acer negundo]
MKFVKPLHLFEELLKRKALRPREHNCNYELTGRLLGLNVGDNYVALAVSNSANATAIPLRWRSIVAVYDGSITDRSPHLRCSIGDNPSAIEFSNVHSPSAMAASLRQRFIEGGADLLICFT